MNETLSTKHFVEFCESKFKVLFESPKSCWNVIGAHADLCWLTSVCIPTIVTCMLAADRCSREIVVHSALFVPMLV